MTTSLEAGIGIKEVAAEIGERLRSVVVLPDDVTEALLVALTHCRGLLDESIDESTGD